MPDRPSGGEEGKEREARVCILVEHGGSILHDESPGWSGMQVDWLVPLGIRPGGMRLDAGGRGMKRYFERGEARAIGVQQERRTRMNRKTLQAQFAYGVLLFGFLPNRGEWAGGRDVGLVRDIESLVENHADVRTVTICTEREDVERAREAVWCWASGGPTLPGRPFEGLFWWSFEANPSVRTFFTALIAYLGGHQVDGHMLSEVECAHAVGTLVNQGRFLIVLDGMEHMVHRQGDNAGLLKDAALRTCLEFLAVAQASLTIAISGSQLFDLTAYVTEQMIVVRPGPDR
jgi:hypothetical protein